MERDETFFAVEQRPHPTAAGGCPIPLLYRDSYVMLLVFSVELERAQARFTGLGVEPWPMAGRTAAILAAFDHRDTSIGAYRELAIAIPCRRVGTQPSLLRFALDMRAQEEQGTWAAWLGVTTEAARAGGVELWGYPRTLATIDTRFEPDRTAVTTEDVTIVAAAPRGPLVRPLPLITYSDRNGRLVRTISELEGGVRVGSGRGASLELGGRGPAADLLRELGLEGKRPLAHLRGEIRARLPLGADLGPIEDVAGRS